jgi:hypothetical protein
MPRTKTLSEERRKLERGFKGRMAELVHEYSDRGVSLPAGTRGKITAVAASYEGLPGHLRSVDRKVRLELEGCMHIDLAPDEVRLLDDSSGLSQPSDLGQSTPPSSSPLTHLSS